MFSVWIKHTYSSSLSYSNKLPLPLSYKLYQKDGDSKFSIDVSSDAKVLRALENEYL